MRRGAVNTHEKLAVRFYQQRKWESALAENQKAIEEESHSESMLFLRAYLFMETKDYPTAEREISQLMSKFGETPETLNLLGLLEMQKGHMDEAKAILERALTLDQKFWKSHFDMGNLYLIKKQYQKAVDEHWTALKSHITWQTIWGLLGSVSLLHPKLFRFIFVVLVIAPFITKSIVGIFFSTISVLFFLTTGAALWVSGKKKEGLFVVFFSLLLLVAYIFSYNFK